MKQINLIKEDISMNLMKTLVKDYIRMIKLIKKHGVPELEKLMFSDKNVSVKQVMKLMKNPNFKVIEKEWTEFEKKYENKIKEGDLEKFAAKYGDSPQMAKLLNSMEDVLYGD